MAIETLTIVKSNGTPNKWRLIGVAPFGPDAGHNEFVVKMRLDYEGMIQDIVMTKNQAIELIGKLALAAVQI